MNYKYLFLFTIILILPLCISKSHNATSYEKQLIKDWKTDSLGCLGLRSYDKAKEIVAIYKLNSKSNVEIETLLGKPNYINHESYLSYSYYFQSFCDSTSRNLIDSMDCCWVEFIFNVGHEVERMDYVWI